jgi:hypothetical protein
MGGRGKELARRAGDGVVVSLLWRQADGKLTVVVNDTRTGETVKLPARADNALEVFNHPYVYLPGMRPGGNPGSQASSPVASD